jgi:SAM-dependent methyltransferase
MSPMSNAQLVRDSFGWDTATWSRCLKCWLEHSAIEPPGNALEVAATGNNGGLSLWLAHRGFDVVWSGLEDPEVRARQLHQEYGLADRISYETIDVLDIPYSDHFDLIVFKSLLGVFGMHPSDALAAQQRALAQIRQALKPGGELWWVENAAGSKLHAILRRRFGWSKHGWRYLRASRVPQLFCDFDQTDYATFGVLSVLGRTEWQRRCLAALDRSLLDRITPAAWRYVVAGVARKSDQTD